MVLAAKFAESTVEEAALEIFGDLGYSILHGADIAPGEMFAERTAYSDVVLVGRLREALKRINPKAPAEAIEEAIRKVLHSDSPNLIASNRRFHQFLTDGIPVEYKGKDRVVHDQLQLIDFKNPANNDWLALNQPEWQHVDDEKGAIKIVMTGSAADVLEWQGHIRNKVRREFLAKRFKDPNDPLKLVIVRDMWLTGFDVPCMHTMYVDKPMQRHGLMQAIARVNRVFKEKPGGLVVDYLGLADQLKKALTDYTESGGKGKPVLDQDEAVGKMLEFYEVCSGMFHGFDYSRFKTGTALQRNSIIPPAQEHILGQEHGKDRFMKTVSQLSKAFALSVPHDRALAVRDDVAFFQTVRAALAKTTVTTGKPQEELDAAVRQIVSRAVASDQVIDIFSAAGLKTPDISILSDEFLAEVKGLPQRNLAFEVLKKLLNDEIKIRSRKNLVQSKLFSQMLEESIRKYQNRSVETAQVIQELIDLAKHMREASKRGEDLGFSDEELAFYDALEVNDSAVKVLGDETLKTIARELVDTVRKNTAIDWTVKESVRAKLRTMVKRILRKYGYPPDKQEKATQTVLEQAELLCRDWAA